MSTMFAILVIEREPLRWGELPGMSLGWLRVVGVLAVFILLFWLVDYLARGRPPGTARRWQPAWFAGVLGVALCLYAIGGGFWLLDDTPATEAILASTGNNMPLSSHASPTLPLAWWWWTAAGGCALLGVLAPFLADLPRWRGRRILAIAQLSFQEALRRRWLWVYLVFLLVILFGSWFLPHRPEDQVRTYVQVIFGALTPLLLITLGLMAASGLPSDIHSQAIHTIVTKPVERFEIVAGRFLGYLGLATVILLVLSLAGLIFLWRGIAPEAAFESSRARLPIYGQLELHAGARTDFQGELIEIWDYRRYIRGGPRGRHRAVWNFTELPDDLAEREVVPCEFALVLFRTSRSRIEGQGVLCTFTFTTPRWDPRRAAEYRRQRDAQPLTPERLAVLAEEFGIHEETRLVQGGRTQSINLPGSLFRAASPAPRADAVPLRLQLKCEEEGQYIGVAKHDLYLVWAEGWFSVNFFKAVAGLWFSLCLVIGVAVACSTYLSSIISWLCAMFLFATGLLRGYLTELAQGITPGGGPGESLIRLFHRERLFLPLEQTPTAQAAAALDEAHRWFLQHVLLPIIPDVERFDWTAYLAEGFDISMSHLALNGVLLLGYLLPWGLLAYYLMKAKEVAG
ncbi:MAG: ABC transporter permease [Gemmataceae bacterium]